MQLIESIVQQAGKSYLQYKASKSNYSRQALEEQQLNNWNKIKRSLQSTAIYNDLNLKYIKSYYDYVEHVPVGDYDFYSPYVSRLESGEKNVLFNDKLECFGLSSGTTGKDSKKVPLNKMMIDQFLAAQRQIAARVTLLEPSINPLGAARLTFGSEPVVYNQNGFDYGYISGILGTKTPSFLKKNTFPSANILSISHWDQKISALIDEAMTQDIQIISGIPTYLISIFEAVLAKTHKKHINEIWPNLKIFIYAATSIDQYQQRMDALVGHNLNYYGLYAATEAAIGIAHSPFSNNSQRYLFNPELLYSFTNLENPSDIRGIHNAKLNTPYYLNIGTPNGFVHYSMKDVVSLEQVNDEITFTFVGRKNTGINLAAEKVTDNQILNAIMEAKNKTQSDIHHYFVSPRLINGKNCYSWTLFVTDLNHTKPTCFAEHLDQAMKIGNPDYCDCREIEVIGSPHVRLINHKYLADYFAANRSKGQFKMKTTFQSDLEYQNFLADHFPKVQLEDLQ